MENEKTPGVLLLQERENIIKKFFSLWIVVYAFVFIGTSQFSFSFPFLEKLVLWFGTTFLHIKDLHKITNTGSGDTTYDFVLVLAGVIFSFLVSLIILIADRKRPNYRQLYLFAIVIARYYVGFTMFTYGLAKIFNGQFPANGLSRLEEKVGDMSPMGMVWAFMGASRAYTFVSGLLEFTGGVLLLFRQTKTFGALFSMTVMLNVALLNFMYDVPVKIFSAHIVLLCVFILSYDWKILFNFFVLHRFEKLDYNKLRVKKKWLQVTLRVIKIVIILAILGISISQLWGTLDEKPAPMEGAYSVKSFVLNHDTIPVAYNSKDSIGWSKMFVDYPGWISIQLNTDKKVWKQVKIDTLKKSFAMDNLDSTSYAFFNYNVRNDTVTFTGTIKKDTANIIFTRKQKKDYSLVNRGFHWVNEYPPNW
ncbi:MAG: hypothetical protein JST21_10540 [Bacteroidetes bacterium]|nr:hypothetical protein [Bacteroidota bacterium]